MLCLTSPLPLLLHDLYANIWSQCCASCSPSLLLSAPCLLAWCVILVLCCFARHYFTCRCPVVGRCHHLGAAERQRGGRGVYPLDPPWYLVEGTAIPRTGAREAQRRVVALLPGLCRSAIAFLALFALLAFHNVDDAPPPVPRIQRTCLEPATWKGAVRVWHC